jgi:hypothetical protein
MSLVRSLSSVHRHLFTFKLLHPMLSFRPFLGRNLYEDRSSSRTLVLNSEGDGVESRSSGGIWRKISS